MTHRSQTAPGSATQPLYLLAYEGTRPVLAGPPRGVRAGHALVGHVTLGRDAWLGAGSIVRADGHFVRIGDGFHLGRGATVHIAHARYATLVGDRVAVGANAVVHACTVESDVVVEEDCVILDGAEVHAGAVLEAGSIVFPRAMLAGGVLYAGRPAKPVREIAADERLERAAALRLRNEAADAGWPCAPTAAHAATGAFVADTAWLAGDVRLAAGASVWFGCRLDARASAIRVGARCNVQDNSVLVAGARGMSLGDDTTIGHNVELLDCQVGARCLVGIGSRIAAGTLIPDDTFVAAGCVTMPGQRLEGGRIWGGQPARVIGSLDDVRRDMVLRTADIYGEYAGALRDGGR